ncbi:MAG TPA: hypothetical protein VF511_01015, partial [Chthoniobacterales bacterium]
MKTGWSLLSAAVRIRKTPFLLAVTFTLATATATATPTATPETFVQVTAGDLVITDDNGGTSADSLTVSLSGANVRITDPNNTLAAGPGATQTDANTVEVPLSSIGGNITVNTLGGNDVLTLDLTGGDFIPASGLFFNGGNPTTGPGDKLVVTGGSQGTVTYNYSNAHDGSIVMSNFGTVTYTGLEPITNSGTASDIVFNLPSGPNAATLADDGTASNGMSRLSGATIETTDFAGPTGSLTINRGNAADTLAVNALPDFDASLTIGSGANPFSTITFNGAVTLAANKNLSGDASNSISLPNTTSDLATSGTGTISLTTARDINIAGGHISVVNGNMTLSANAAATNTATTTGIDISTAASLTSSGTGAISLTGKGGSSAVSGGLRGIYIHGASTVSSTSSSGSAGAITINATGGTFTGADGGLNNAGLVIQ